MDRNPTYADQHVGNRLRARRLELDLAQQDLAAELGITFQQLQKYELGKNRISAGRLYEIAKVLKTTIMYFYSGLDGVTAMVRRGVAEEVSSFSGAIDHEAAELLVGFRAIQDANVRKSLLDVVKKQSKTSKPPKR